MRDDETAGRLLFVRRGTHWTEATEAGLVKAPLMPSDVPYWMSELCYQLTAEGSNPPLAEAGWHGGAVAAFGAGSLRLGLRYGWLGGSPAAQVVPLEARLAAAVFSPGWPPGLQSAEVREGWLMLNHQMAPEAGSGAVKCRELLCLSPGWETWLPPYLSSRCQALVAEWLGIPGHRLDTAREQSRAWQADWNNFGSDEHAALPWRLAVL